MSEPDLEPLKLAFTYHLAEQVIGADGRVDPEEAAFLEEHFPREPLEEAGFLDDAGEFTDAYRAAVEQALRVLPARLDEPAKRELMKVIREAAWVDTMGDEKESNVLIVAARLLGLDPREWAQV